MQFGVVCSGILQEFNGGCRSNEAVRGKQNTLAWLKQVCTDFQRSQTAVDFELEGQGACFRSVPHCVPLIKSPELC